MVTDLACCPQGSERVLLTLDMALRGRLSLGVVVVRSLWNSWSSCALEWAGINCWRTSGILLWLGMGAVTSCVFIITISLSLLKK